MVRTTHIRLLALTATAALVAGACSSGDSSAGPASDTTEPATTSTTTSASAAEGPDGPVPAVDVTVLSDGLDHPWDVVTAPDGTILVTERPGRFGVIRPGSTGVTPVDADLGSLFVGSETGLMAVALAPDFEASRTVYSCQGFSDGSATDVRVVAWTAAPDWSSLTPTRTVIDGFPITNGRHGGCRLLPQTDGTLYIGTGDSAQPSVPQDRESLGGKVLRVDAATGAPAAGNPDPASPIFTLGHRNVQGLAQQPGTDRIYAVEQGTSRDDEVNLLRTGANYGYSPDRSGSGYDESVAMTDPDRVPGAVEAVWSSGEDTIATASGSFLTGAGWGSWDGALAVGVQKGEEVLLLDLAADGNTVAREATIPEISGPYGRIRTVVGRPDGSLLVTTDNGETDSVLLVTPITG